MSLLINRAGQRPCKYKQSMHHTERRGIIVGINNGKQFNLVQDSSTGEIFQVPWSLCKEVTLFGPEDMPNEDYLKQYFGGI